MAPSASQLNAKLGVKLGEINLRLHRRGRFQNEAHTASADSHECCAHTALASNSRHNSRAPESRAATAAPTDPETPARALSDNLCRAQACSPGPNTTYTQAPATRAKYTFAQELFTPYLYLQIFTIPCNGCWVLQKRFNNIFAIYILYVIYITFIHNNIRVTFVNKLHQESFPLAHFLFPSVRFSIQNSRISVTDAHSSCFGIYFPPSNGSVNRVDGCDCVNSGRAGTCRQVLPSGWFDSPQAASG